MVLQVVSEDDGAVILIAPTNSKEVQLPPPPHTHTNTHLHTFTRAHTRSQENLMEKKKSKVTKEVRQILVANKGKMTLVLNPCLDAPGPDGVCVRARCVCVCVGG
jgi:hypothetical protein